MLIRPNIKNPGAYFAWAVLLALLLFYFAIHPLGLTTQSAAVLSNQIAVLALVSVGQAIVVFGRELDLSVGSILALTNCLASFLLSGSSFDIIAGLLLVVAAGAVCGVLNGIVVVIGKVQSIIATIATGAIFSGLALLVRPIPGGAVDANLSDWATYDLFGVPSSALFVLVSIALLWWTVQARPTGRAIFAFGSNPQAAFMSGLPLWRARIGAFVLSGVFAGLGGLFLAFQTLSGDANSGLPYTLNSIAAVVLGGVALSGGRGTVLGVVAGAGIIRTLGALLFFTGISPLAQPLIQGLVLGAAVAVGAVRLIGANSKLEIFK